MYKRLAIIAVLMGLPILIQPAGQASESDVASTSDVATTQVDVGEPAISLTATTDAPPLATSTTRAPTTTTTTATTSAPTTAALPTTVAPTTIAEPAAPAAAAPTTTAPTTTVAPTTTAPPPVDHVARGEAALAGIGYNWRGNLPGWTITFSPARDGVIGYTYTNEHRIEIFVRDNISDGLLRHVIAHEIGHAIDVSLNSSGDRERWQDARGIGGSPWWPGNGVSDYSTGAGDFAESFAAWQVGAGNFRSNLGSAPSGDQIALLAELAG